VSRNDVEGFDSDLRWHFGHCRKIVVPSDVMIPYVPNRY